jgi:hypothetical protein
MRPLALGPEGRGAGVAGARAAMAPGALATGALGVRAPASTGVALAARAWPPTIWPPSCLEGCWARFGMAAVGHRSAHRHGGASPGVVKPLLHWGGEAHLCMTCVRADKPR